MAYEKVTIEEFMEAWFEQKNERLSESDFKIVYAEYLDASGLFMSDDFEKRSLIHHLNSRINYVKMFIRLQRDFMKEFDMPFIRDFESFKDTYGYVLKWKGDLKEFESQLKKIETRQIKHDSFLEEKIQELNEHRAKMQQTKKDEPEVDLKKSRMSFIRMLNSLGKIGFKIDKKTTTVEELALMIKQQLEENDSQNIRK